MDFVIEKGEEIIGFEVKSDKDNTNKGMSIFAGIFRPKRMFTVGTDGIPVEEFLMIKPEILFEF